MSQTGAGNHRNIPLQALRGLAACAVMVYHAAHFTVLRGGAPWLENVFSGQLAVYGVLVFFVLSGFLMESAVRRYEPGTFLLHRFVRLYPTYWLVCLGFFLVQSARAGAWQDIPWKALNLMPLGEMTRPLGVEWTLLYEVFFYIVCTLLCFWRRAHLPVHLVWLAIVAVVVFRFHQFGTTMQPTFFQVPFSAWNIGFICGGLAGHVNRWNKSIEPATLWLAGIALVLLGSIAPAVVDQFLTCPGLACIVLALARAPAAETRAPGLGLRILFLLGEYSYGLYLAHCLAIQIALQYIPAARMTQTIGVFAGMVGVGLTVGLLAGGVDVLLYRTLKRAIDARTRRRSLARVQPATD